MTAVSAGRKITVLHILRSASPTHRSIERVYADVRAHKDESINYRVWESPYPSRGILPRLRAMFAIRRQKGDVYHITGDAHYLTLLLPRARTLLTIHDTEFLDRAHGLKRLLLWIFWFRLPAWRCARIVAISEQTRRDIQRHLSISSQQIVVIPNPLSKTFYPSVPRKIEGSVRILQIGTKANKNLERLSEALSGLGATLTIVGPLSETQRNAIAKHDLHVETCCDLTEDQLRQAYANCDILTCCSLAEGFCLPIIEGQATGRPVVTSDRSPMSEVAGGAACLVDPESVEDIRKGIQRIISDDVYRSSLVAMGHLNAARYGADEISNQYVELYHDTALNAES